MYLYCFDVIGNDETWTICAKDQLEVEDWREKLIMNIIVTNLIGKGFTSDIPIIFGTDTSEC